MQLALKKQINEMVKTEDCLRYLQFRGKGLSERWLTDIEETRLEVLEDAHFREIVTPIEKSKLPASYDLAKTLENTEDVAVVLCTLGHQVSQSIKQLMLTSPSKGIIYDAWASVFIEAYADHLQLELGVTTKRFSPGYGDLPLSCQDEWLTRLDAAARIGVYTTPASLMIPEKSIFYFVGLCGRTKKVSSEKSKCFYCNKKQCDFRREI